MVDYLQPSRFLCLFLAAATAVGCSAKVKVESARSATASDTDEAVESQTTEKARTEVQVEFLESRPEGAATKPPPQTPPEGKTTTTVIFNMHDGDVHFHEDQQRTTTEASSKTPQASFLNTKIRWPSAYWQRGLPAWAGSVIVWLLVGSAVAMMLATVGRLNGGPLVEIIGLLVAAAIVLQFLPDTDSGFQLIPISPWLYSGWLSFFLSILSWLSLITAILIALTGCSDAPGVFSALILFSMAINLLLSFGG